MKLHTIIVSLWFMTSFAFASEIKKEACPSGCGPIEHIFSKNIVKKYAEQNHDSGLNINHDNEDIPTNIVQAVIAFGLQTQLIDSDGNPIIPQPFKDTQDMVLPMYKSQDFLLRKSIVGTTSIDDTSSTSQILKIWEDQYKLSKISMKKYEAINSSVTQDGIVICQPCSITKRK